MIGELVKYLFKLLLIACSFDSCGDLVAEIFYDCWLGFDQARHSFKIVWKRVNLIKNVMLWAFIKQSATLTLEPGFGGLTKRR